MKSYQIQPGDLDPEDQDLVTEEAVRRYIREAASLPAALDIELTDNDWFTQGASGSWYVDGPEVQILVND